MNARRLGRDLLMALVAPLVGAEERDSDELLACRSNLRNVGTALEV